MKQLLACVALALYSLNGVVQAAEKDRPASRICEQCPEEEDVVHNEPQEGQDSARVPRNVARVPRNYC